MRAHARQKGVAVITALLLTTLAVTIVASLFWQQQVQVRSIENQRLQLQKQWILRGALDWARLILRADRNISGDVDHLGEPWAVPLAETRLDQYVEKKDTGNDITDAALSGGISDAQARFNLKNLCVNGKINDTEVAAFRKLLSLLQVNPELAQATAIVMQSAQPKLIAAGTTGTADGSTQQPLDILHPDDLLAVPGFTPELLAKIKDYIVVLPIVTKININTAPAEVIAAKVDKLSLSDAASLVAARQGKVFYKLDDVRQYMPSAGDISPVLDVKTEYFLVNGNVRLNRAGMEMQALIYRTDKAQTILWIRQY
ncbi:general secretion pathway protein GspK [Herbaspirillum sp. HC18]|nr:general secretion pathway protein GspK [Herbaspirillum sp. HC18]